MATNKYELRQAAAEKGKGACIAIFVLMLLCAGLAILALYCRAEWLDAEREFDRQRERRVDAEISRDMWKHKYELLLFKMGRKLK